MELVFRVIRLDRASGPSRLPVHATVRACLATVADEPFGPRDFIDLTFTVVPPGLPAPPAPIEELERLALAQCAALLQPAAATALLAARATTEPAIGRM